MLAQCEWVQVTTAFAVDPSTNRFGGAIDLAQTQMSRDPLLLWSLVAALGLMVTPVLAANLFADGARDAFDRRLRNFRPKWREAVASRKGRATSGRA